MLDELRIAQDETLRQIECMEQAIRSDVPPPRDQLAMLRWQLTRVSARRRKLVETRIYPALGALPEPDATRVKALREEQPLLLAAASRHITVWTIERVYADWPGYQAEMQCITPRMRDRLARERAVLFPLLRQKNQTRAA